MHDCCRFAYGLYCARLWHIGSLDPKCVPFGRFNNGLQPSCFISWPRIMLWVWENTFVVQRPVLNVIMTRYMFSRNGFTSSQSYGHVVWCTFHRVLAEMELHKSALIEWVRMPNILIIHLGDKKKTPSWQLNLKLSPNKVFCWRRVLCYGNDLPFLTCIWKGKFKEQTATVDITVHKERKFRTSCQPEDLNKHTRKQT